ncbi:phospholipase-like protein [Tanacetum coccineum]|uniref:Phospholipase-like protein n=1 Tax=Tanacetum coccineum TaxID=301880 RepID=A0ABQ4WGJ0_9ASTR
MLGRQMLLVVTGLKFGVEYSVDYDDEDKPIPFRRRVFPSCLDGKHITGKNVEDLIKSKSFKKLDDDDVVSLCCIGILQLVLLGVEDRRAVPNWILRDANVKHWLPLYATELTNEDDKKSYSIFRFTCAFKGRVPAERLILDEIEVGSGWWVSSRAYFDGHEQRSGLDQMMKQGQNIFEKMNKFMEDMSVGTGANKEPIIVDQHYGISDLSGFQSIQSPYTPLPPTTELPMKRVGKTKKKCKNDNLSPLNLGNTFAYDNAGGDDVVIMGVHDTVPNFFWRQLVPHLCMPRSHSVDNPYQEGWLSGDQMNAWIEILIRSRPQNADWTVSKSGTVYMPINVGGNHWVTGAVNLPHSVFYVFDSMKSERTRLLLEHQIKA